MTQAVCPRDRSYAESTQTWTLQCGICGHRFDARKEVAPRMTVLCPNCGTYNVWNEEGRAQPEAESA